ESLVRLASAVRREWLPAERLTTTTEVTFDTQAERLVARKQVRFEDLVIDDTPAHVADEAEAARVLAAAAADRPGKALPPPDSPAGQFRTRVRCLRAWVPELGLPPLDDADLRPALEQLCRGLRSLEQVRNAPWLDALRGLLTYQQLQVVEREVPERI